MDRLLAVVGAIAAISCGSNKASSPTTEPAGSGTPPAGSATGSATPPAGSATGSATPPAGPPPRAIAAADLAGDYTCGPFKTSAFTAKDQALLDDRIRFRFLAGGTMNGGTESAKLEITRGAFTMFVGARELVQRGDATFPLHAAKNALFDGGYEAISIAGRDAAIVAGLLAKGTGNPEIVALAHGWFLDPSSSVLDVAIFASGITDANLAQCQQVALKILSTVGPGARKLVFGTGTDVEAEVSYSKFKYKLPADWILMSSAGIHDFARMEFRKRGVYPVGYTSLQLGLDSHPGDWKSSGSPDGTRPGTVFGLEVTWNLTKDASGPLFGAWTISKDVVNRDHAVASITSMSAADRDDAIKLAESIRR